MSNVINIKPTRMSLGSVERGRQEVPLRAVLSGQEGVGKSCFAAGAPMPIFLPTEKGTSHLDVARFPQPKSTTDIFDACNQLLTEAHPYKTLVVDTIDWLEPLVYADVCAEHGKPSIEDFGYGKGYVWALDKWRQVLRVFDSLTETKGMNVILLAHTHVKTFKNPSGDDYDRHTLKLRDTTSALVKEWADAVFFAEFEVLVDDDGKRTRGVATGKRIMHTTRRLAHDAKNRMGLPEVLALSWPALEEARKAAQPEVVRARTLELVKQIKDDATRAKAEAFVRGVGDDVNSLIAAESRVKEIVK